MKQNYSHVRWILLVVAVNFLLVTALIVAQEEDGEVKWGYEGDTGPENWASLSEDFAVCGEGTSQSPIDIVGPTTTMLTPIEFAYEEVPLGIFNNGHTIEIEYEEGSHIVYNEKTYDVLQFHFHQPSEHTIDGQSFAMELHIVHQDPNSGNLAVVGVMLAEGDEASTDAYDMLFANLPAEVGEPNHETDIMINVADLLPEDTMTFFTYEGSLTTPPCSQNVRWLVLAEPVTLSAEQIAAFGAIYDGNARPVQPLNTRDLFTNAG